MKSQAALLRRSGQGAPYAATAPFEIIEVDLDGPREGEVLVRVTAAGVCHSDLSVLNGSRPRPLPLIGGHEATGIVEGELIRGGTRTSYKGEKINHYNGVSCYSQYAIMDERSLVKIPSDLPKEIAAIFGCALLTGIGAVRHGAQVTSGASVGIWGLGGVGIAALLGAVIANAGVIIAVDPVAAKRKLALELGAHFAIDPSEDIREYLKTGVQFAIEAVGKSAALKQAYEGTARGGTTVTVGLPAPTEQLSISAVSLVTDAKTLKGSYLGSGDPRKDIPEFVKLWQDGKLPVEKLISKCRPMSEINEAMDELQGAEVVRQIIYPWE